MKNFSQILVFIAFVASTLSLNGQAVFTDITFQHTSSNSSKWEVFENGGNLSNGSVATLRTQGGQSRNFAERYSSFGTAVIRFNTCLAAGKTFTVKWNTYNWLGGNVGSGTFQATITPPPSFQPQIAFSSINGACTQVTLCVSNSLPGAVYTWNSGSQTNGACAVFNAPPPANVTVTGTCGTLTLSTSQAPPLPPDFTPRVEIKANGQSGAAICPSESLFLDGVSNTCVNGPSNWVWSGPGISNQIVTSGSTSRASFDSQGQSGGFQISLTVTDFAGNIRTALFNIQVLPQSDPQCSFIQKRLKDNNPNAPQVQISNNRKMEVVSENTEGVKEDNVSINGNAKATLKKVLYPNPAKDFLNVEGINDVEILEVVDLSGRVVRTVLVEENEIMRTINVGNLSDGLYILKKIKRDGQLEAVKFQVSH